MITVERLKELNFVETCYCGKTFYEFPLKLVRPAFLDLLSKISYNLEDLNIAFSGDLRGAQWSFNWSDETDTDPFYDIYDLEKPEELNRFYDDTAKYFAVDFRSSL